MRSRRICATCTELICKVTWQAHGKVWEKADVNYRRCFQRNGPEGLSKTTYDSE
jgi:hypothetical protein